MIAISTIFALMVVFFAGRALADGNHHAVTQGVRDDDHAALGQPGDPNRISRTIQVEMEDTMRFKPSTINAKRGETIQFLVRNVGKIRHEMVLGTASELKEHAKLMKRFPNMEHDDPNQIALEPSKSGTIVWRFTKTGTLEFACLQPGHMEAGMVGKVLVR